MSTQERLGEFEELILLSVGSLGNETYSVRIKTLLEEDANRRAALGAIYAALDRLERKGLVRSWLGQATATRGGRRKRFYAVTRQGLAALSRRRQSRELLWGRIEPEWAGAEA